MQWQGKVYFLWFNSLLYHNALRNVVAEFETRRLVTPGKYFPEINKCQEMILLSEQIIHFVAAANVNTWIANVRVNLRSLEGGGGVKLIPPSIFLPLNFWYLTDYNNRSLFVNKYIDTK